MYKYDLHVHTSEVSSCGRLSAEETVRRYIDAGYSGICITDHYIPSFFNGRTGAWCDMANAFLEGWRKAKEAAAGRIDVILGAELRFGRRYNANDYLVYGLTEEIIYAYPELCKLSVPEFSRIAKKHNLLLIQAHPMRDNMERVHLDLLDGMEVYNAHPEQNSRNESAARLARGHDYILTSGSDCHAAGHVGRGGIITDVRIKNSTELCDILLSEKYELIAPFDPMTV